VEDALSDGILGGKFTLASMVRLTVDDKGELLMENADENQAEPTLN